MINYKWITTQPITPPSFPHCIQEYSSICIYFQSAPSSFDALSVHTYTQIHKSKLKTAAFCVQVSGSLLGDASAPHRVLNDDARVSWDLAMLSRCHYDSTDYSPSSLFPTRCVTACLCLSSYASHCIWPRWLSHILHSVSTAPEAACSQTAGKKKRGTWAAWCSTVFTLIY